jgi:hypothetical protein
MAEFALIAGGTTAAAIFETEGGIRPAVLCGMIAVVTYVNFLRRIHRAHFAWNANLLALFGLPVFAFLLMRSQLSYKKGAVTWKGRTYGARAAAQSKQCRLCRWQERPD